MEYGFIVVNPNTDYGAEFASVRIDMKDASGQVLGTQQQMLTRSLTRARPSGWPGPADPNGSKPARVEFTVEPTDGKWKPADQMEPPHYKRLIVSGLRARTSAYSTAFVGMVQNPNSVAFDMVTVAVLLRNANGKIVAGYPGYMEKLGAGVKKPFQVMAVGNLPKYSKFEVYAQP